MCIRDSPTTDDVTRYKKLKEVLLDTGKEYKTLEIASTRFFKNLVIVKFKEMCIRDRFSICGSTVSSRSFRYAGDLCFGRISMYFGG